jgi:hypothetical protein
MRGEAMVRICTRLKSQGIDMNSLAALDFFAREGDWQTIVYAREVGSLEAWEINPDFLSGLQRNLPGAILRIVDSYEFGSTTDDRFDFVVLDNPQATFGPDARYCEHFEALPVALRLLRPGAFLIFNINWAPFNFQAHPEWRRRRSEFYGVDDTASLSPENFLLPFYRRYFEARGCKVLQAFVEPRNDEYLAYMVFRLEPA